MRLSICIPTYNRARYIGTLLKSIELQKDYGCEVEVIISDNASTDDTPLVVERYRAGLPQLRYERYNTNVGPDRNFLRVVELATGDYCWLMGDDDVLEPGAIARIEKAIRDHPEISGLSVYRNAYTSDLSERLVERPVAGGKVEDNVPITGAERIFSVLAEYICFLSAQVIARPLWLRVASEEDLRPYFNSYIHVYVIGRMLIENPVWLYVAHPCVGWRSGNDSFMTNGAFKRMMIDINGMDQITGDLFGRGSRTYRQVNATTASVQVRYGVMGAKLGKYQSSFAWRAAPILFRRYWRYPEFWLKTVPVLATPGLVLRTIRLLYRTVARRNHARFAKPL